MVRIIGIKIIDKLLFLNINIILLIINFIINSYMKSSTHKSLLQPSVSPVDPYNYF